MHLCKIYDFHHYRSKRDEDLVHCKIARIAENAHLLGSVIQLKQHFKEWLELEKQRTNQCTKPTTKDKMIYG